MPDDTQLDISAADAHAYDVTITDPAGGRTTHHVRVPERFLAELGVAEAQEPTLVRASLAYLLEREPPSSILPDFSLEDIARYFPDYRNDITRLI